MQFILRKMGRRNDGLARYAIFLNSAEPHHQEKAQHRTALILVANSLYRNKKFD
jgi:hypothetical protein